MYAPEAPCPADSEHLDTKDDDNPLISIVSKEGRRDDVDINSCHLLNDLLSEVPEAGVGE